jgi:penicillin-binding protein-related factor A (putative recombinase)
MNRKIEVKSMKWLNMIITTFVDAFLEYIYSIKHQRFPWERNNLLFTFPFIEFSNNNLSIFIPTMAYFWYTHDLNINVKSISIEEEKEHARS